MIKYYCITLDDIQKIKTQVGHSTTSSITYILHLLSHLSFKINSQN
jgi:hypothetical protein